MSFLAGVLFVDNRVDLLIQNILPVQQVVEIVRPVRALLGAQEAYLHDVADELLRRLTVLFIHGQQEEGQHDQHHAKGRRAAADMALEQKEERYADERAAAKAQNLPFC